ncbi:MAG: hypothetical protein JNK02_05885 [Planctomycetes bacterium]|nr:hypothetical protein [Planctomycetota bacterium]
MSARAPFVLGARGAPLEAPENTRASFAAAYALGLDGVAGDLRACASGELVVHADPGLERTTDGQGPIAERRWTELADLDAGTSFQARFRGERLLLAEELLALADLHGGASSLLLCAHGALDVGRLAALARELAPRAAVRLAADDREVVRAARDAGLAAAAVAPGLDERLLERVRAEPVAALLTPLEAWRAPLAAEDWPLERWATDVDAPADLLDAQRLGLHAFTTREPRRALAARALHALAPGFEGPWPVEPEPIEVHPEAGSLPAGDWSGSWTTRARIVNPFAFPVRVRVGFVVRRGAFDVSGLPRAFELAPGASELLTYSLTGGARRPGGDPLVVARFAWARGPGRVAGELDVDAPVARVRTAVADAIPRRIVLLRDDPRERAATLVLRRRAGHLVVALESPGVLAEPSLVVRLGARTFRGRRGVRLPLPDDFDARRAGIAFTCGLEAWDRGERVVRPWAGGLGAGADAGALGVLLPGARA